MPISTFVPVIGSGFDQVAAQQAGWAGFNANQDTANLRRRQMADEAANRWFEQLAQLQQSEAQRADAAATAAASIRQKAQADALNAQAVGAQMAEERRKFDITTKLNEKAYTFQQEKEAAANKKQTSYIDDFGSTFAPRVRDAGAAHEAAQQELAKASDDLMRVQAEWRRIIPNSQWNPKTGQIEKVDPLTGKIVPWPTTDAKEFRSGLEKDVSNDYEAAQKANEQFSEARAKYQEAIIKSKQAEEDWKGIQKLTSTPDIYPIRRDDGTWGLHSPVTKQDYFARALAEAKKNAAAAVTPLPNAPATALTSFQGWTDTTQTGTAPLFTPVVAPAPSPTGPGLSMPNVPMFGGNPATFGQGAGWAAPVVQRVRVRSPQGATGTIPASQLQAAISKGYKLVSENE
jgi:hypothetical protein